jgi:hypothetical protein
MHPLRRIVWSAAAVLALTLPASALAGHDLGIYKAETQVNLTSDEQFATVGCKPGDHALDGMWRIDHADQDDDDRWKTAIARSVDVLEAFPIDGSTYRFQFVKQAIGRAQAKVFVTCLQAQTAWDEGHAHKVEILPALTQSHAGLGKTELTPDWTAAGGTAECPAGTWAATPGFRVTSPASDLIEPGTGRLYASHYADSRMRNWRWAFQLPPTGGQVDLTLRCLKIRVQTLSGGSAPAGNRHKLIGRYQQYSPTYRKKRVDEGQTSCGSHYKAVVSGFALDPAQIGSELNSWSTTKLWYLGQDPRIKTRAVRVLNSGPAEQSVDTRSLCLNDRTT